MLAVALAGVAIWKVHPRPGATATSPDALRGSGPAADQGPAVAAALQRLSTDPGSLVSSAAAARVGADAGKAVPVGAVVSPDPGSWAPDGIGGGTMLVTITPPAGARTTYAAVMVSEEGQWKVLTTFPLGR
ncbi:hypothetical protein [Paractinoplanes durhamensis]|uniref:hypothetical protein n=1 Tax=Paractinoplanes durhamensis TaxID=113563 RepID=UPI00363C6A82